MTQLFDIIPESTEKVIIANASIYIPPNSDVFRFINTKLIGCYITSNNTKVEFIDSEVYNCKLDYVGINVS